MPALGVSVLLIVAFSSGVFFANQLIFLKGEQGIVAVSPPVPILKVRRSRELDLVNGGVNLGFFHFLCPLSFFTPNHPIFFLKKDPSSRWI